MIRWRSIFTSHLILFSHCWQGLKIYLHSLCWSSFKDSKVKDPAYDNTTEIFIGFGSCLYPDPPRWLLNKLFIFKQQKKKRAWMVSPVYRRIPWLWPINRTVLRNCGNLPEQRASAVQFRNQPIHNRSYLVFWMHRTAFATFSIVCYSWVYVVAFSGHFYSYPRGHQCH